MFRITNPEKFASQVLRGYQDDDNLDFDFDMLSDKQKEEIMPFLKDEASVIFKELLKKFDNPDRLKHAVIASEILLTMASNPTVKGLKFNVDLKEKVSVIYLQEPPEKKSKPENVVELAYEGEI